MHPESATQKTARISKRTILSVKEKHEICQFKDSHPNYSHQNVADHFSTTWGKKISRRVIGDILADRHKWSNELQTNGSVNNIRIVKRLKGGKHEDLEDLLELWVTHMQQNGTLAEHSVAAICGVTDIAITEQAKIIGQKLGIEEFRYSSGWLHRFKRRRGLLQARAKPMKPLPPLPPPSLPPPQQPPITEQEQPSSTLDTCSTSAVFSCTDVHVFSKPDDCDDVHVFSKTDCEDAFSKTDCDDVFSKSVCDNVHVFSKPDVEEMYLICERSKDQDVLDEFFLPRKMTEQLEHVTADDARHALRRLRVFFHGKVNGELVAEKLADIELEINNCA